jgi:hypothetical protein
MERTTVADDDEGKRVVNASGVEIGTVSTVRDGVAHVDPDPGITDAIRSKLGWGDADQGDYALESTSIGAVTDDEIRLKDGF